MISLILGGARSGKTSYALRQCLESGLRPFYFATATAGDAEMADRIARHKEERGAEWTTIEEPLDLPRRLVDLAKPDTIILVDCLTLWLSNILFSDLDCDAMSAELVRAISCCTGQVVFVSNEVGLGIVPDNALARRFRDLQGRLNQKIAKEANHVVFMAAGLPLILKGNA